VSAAPPVPPGRWIVVLVPRATFAIVVAGGEVVAAAPIGRRYIGRDVIGLDEREAARRLRGCGARFHPLA
jgi:hypothetical protein